jgi:multimeric flavodoxin WrbA
MAAEVNRRAFLGKAGSVAAVGAASGTILTAQSTQAAEGQEAGTVKILGICGSPRKGKSTSTGLGVCLEAAGQVGPQVETELIELAELSIPGQVAAGVDLKPGEEDDFPAVAAKLSDPKVAGIIVGSPVYFGCVSALCKAFLDRLIVFRKDQFALAGKVAGALAVGGGRDAGKELVLRQIHTALMGQGLIIVGDGPPTSHWGATLWSGHEGGVTADEMGMATARNLGRHVAQTALKLVGSAQHHG